MELITHNFESNQIPQRAEDGYVNLTKMIKAAGRHVGHYLGIESTKAFLCALSSDIGIPISGLVQSQKGGAYLNQGTWGHPQVAIHCAQWCSPEFAVLVTKWVFDWMSQNKTPASDMQIRISAEQSMQTIDVQPIAVSAIKEPAIVSAIEPKEELALIEAGYELIMRLGGADPRHLMLLKDRVMNVMMSDKLLPQAGAKATHKSHALTASNSAAGRLEYPITDRCAELGHRPSQYELLDIGRKVSALYKKRHGRQPVKREQFVGGTTRMVNVYSQADVDLLDEAIKAVMG